MNLFNDRQDQVLTPINETELVQKQKQEFKLVGTYLKTPGLKLFCLNPSTEKVQEVSIVSGGRCCILVINEDRRSWEVKPLERDRIEVNSTWDYFEALNQVSAEKRVEKWRSGKIKDLWNLRIPGMLDPIKLF